MRKCVRRTLSLFIRQLPVGCGKLPAEDIDNILHNLNPQVRLGPDQTLQVDPIDRQPGNVS